MSSDLFQAKETFHYEENGFVRKGQLARVGHPILASFPDMFEPVTVDFEHHVTRKPASAKSA